MADTITFFGNAVLATYPDGTPIIVNGRPLLVPQQNYSLQQQIDAAHYQATIGASAVSAWFVRHFPPGGSGDPQRQAGVSGGFDPRFTDAGNYGYGLSAAAAGISLDVALQMASIVNLGGTSKSLPAANERAIRQGYDDYKAHFPDVDDSAGQAYVKSVFAPDAVNAASIGGRTITNLLDIPGNLIFTSKVAQSDAQRYAIAKWGDINSPDAAAFIANFQQAFSSYPQHLDIDLLQPLPVGGGIPSGRDVSLFVGKDGQVLVYARTPAPGALGDSSASLD
ncbi:hypothetical protein [Bradyrhizobium genosp. A]|uniref:hypothetical protein n=1 Tax=Bradyrhizobium genosp. A TaxID=83626 RepID=UPI003CF060B6